MMIAKFAFPAALALTALTMISGVSEARMPKTSSPVVMKAGENYQVIEFSKGSDALSAEASQQLRTLIDTAKSANTIDRVYVAAWSDEEFPVGKAKVSKKERELAERRLKAVDKFAKDDLNVGPVSNYNMAERSTWFSRLFRTNDAKVKSLFNAAGAPRDVRPEQLLTVKSKGGPDRAVIVLRLRDEAAKTARRTNVVAPVIADRETAASASTASATTTSASDDATRESDNSRRGWTRQGHMPQNHNSLRTYDYNNDSNAQVMRATGDSSHDDNYNGPKSPANDR